MKIIAAQQLRGTSVTYFMGVMATIVTALAELWYFRSIYKDTGGSRPSRMTWLLLSTIAWVIALNSYLANANETLWPLIMGAIGSTVVFAMSIKNGSGGWSFLDRAVLIGATLILAFTFYVNSPLIGLVLALSFDLLAILPTLSSLYRNPRMEEWSPWALTVTANVFSVLAIGDPFSHQKTAEILLPPLYFLAINSLVLAFTLRRPSD